MTEDAMTCGVMNWRFKLKEEKNTILQLSLIPDFQDRDVKIWDRDVQRQHM